MQIVIRFAALSWTTEPHSKSIMFFPSAGYTKTILPLPEIVRTKIPVFPHDSGYAIDKDGYLLSDFGNCPNPMLD